MKFINKIFLVLYVIMESFSVNATSDEYRNKIADMFLNICVFSADEDDESKNSSSNESLKNEFKKILSEVIKTKSGYILICKILEIMWKEENINFEQCVSELEKFNGIVDVSWFKRKHIDLNPKIFEAIIKNRNQAISKKIMFRKSDTGYFIKPTGQNYKEPLTVYYRVKNIDVLGISKIGSLEKVESSPDIGLFHELLHLYHYINNPIITDHFKEIQTNVNQIVKIQKYDLNAYQKVVDNIPIGVSLEEMLTIRGKPKTMYELSENSYRANKKELLRFSHSALNRDERVDGYYGYYNIDNPEEKTDNKSTLTFNGKDIYEAYYERAHGGKNAK